MNDPYAVAGLVLVGAVALFIVAVVVAAVLVGSLLGQVAAALSVAL